MKNVLILTYWNYKDALIQTYTLPYVRIIERQLPEGSTVFLLTLEKDKNILIGETRNKIEAELSARNIKWIPFLYRPFGIAAFFSWLWTMLHLGILISKNKIRIIHCWCTPPGAIGYFLSVFLRKKLIIDSYEPHAESMVENGTWARTGIAFRLLFWLEKKQTQRAHYIISATEGMRQYAKIKYGVDIESFFVKPACVDFRLFDFQQPADEFLRQELNLESKVVCVYAGKFGGIYLDHSVFDFVRMAIEHWGDSFRLLLLTSHSKKEIEGYCTQAGVDIRYVVMRFVPHSEVPRYMKLAHFALTPVKPVPTKRYCTPIKDGEYWALGLPVVIPAHISDDSDIIRQNQIGVVLYDLNKEAYRKAVSEMDILLRDQEIGKKTHDIALRYRNFSIAEKVYGEVYSSI